MKKWLGKLKHGIMLRLPKLTNLKRFIREYRCEHPDTFKFHVGTTRFHLCNECGRFTTIIGEPEIINSHNILVR